MLSLFLSISLLLSMAVPAAYAADEDVVPDSGSVVSETTAPTETEPAAQTEPEETQAQATEPAATQPAATEPETTQPQATEPEVTEPEVTEPEVTEPQATEPEVTEPQATEPQATEPEATEPETTVPECDCGNEGAALESHGDGCTLKKYYMKTVCSGTADEIYAAWDTFPVDGQVFILEYLSWTDQTKLAALNALLGSGSDTTPDSSVTETTDDGTKICAAGVPEGASLVVSQASEEAKAAIDAELAAREDSANQLFLWDISVQDASGAAWQPDGTVRVELTIPGVTLHKYAEVFVLHVDDSGETSYVEAEVTADGGIAFVTDGFSTFAGFTVDFEYGGAFYSIYGLESILLSELLDVLQVPIFLSDLADVTFTDPALISVEKQADGDWLLTSLGAFETTETLTITMKDGRVYNIVVTDAASPTIQVGSGTAHYDSNNIVTWRANGSGTLTQYADWCGNLPH